MLKIPGFFAGILPEKGVKFGENTWEYQDTNSGNSTQVFTAEIHVATPVKNVAQGYEIFNIKAYVQRNMQLKHFSFEESECRNF